MVVDGWNLMNLDLELILNHKDIWLSFDIFHSRWHWSTRTCGRSSTSTGPRWSSPSQAGEFNFLLLATCAILPNLENNATQQKKMDIDCNAEWETSASLSLVLYTSLSSNRSLEHLLYSYRVRWNDLPCSQTKL